MEKKYLTGSSERVVAYLDKLQVPFDLITHDNIQTDVTSASIQIKEKPSNAVKALVMKVDNSRYIIVGVQGSERADYKKIKRIIRSNNLSLASPDEAQEVTGFLIGTIPPFGGMFGIDTIIDIEVFRNEYVLCGSGSTNVTIRIPTKLMKGIPGHRVESVAA